MHLVVAPRANMQSFPVDEALPLPPQAAATATATAVHVNAARRRGAE